MTQRRGRWRWVLGLLVAHAVGRGISGLVAGAAQAEALGVRPSWRLFAAMDLSLRTVVAAVAALGSREQLRHRLAGRSIASVRTRWRNGIGQRRPLEICVSAYHENDRPGRAITRADLGVDR